MAAVIIEGRTLSTSERSGKRDDGTAWQMHSARVLVADRDVTEVTYDPATLGVIRQGDQVSILAEASVYRGAPSFRALAVSLIDDAALPAA